MSVTVDYDEKTGIYKSRYKIRELPKVSFYERVLGDTKWDEKVESFIETSPTKRSITNSAIKLQAQQLGVGLIKNAGLKPGQVVMIISGNSIEFPIVLLGAAFAGLRVALANPAYQTNELRHVISLTKPEKIFVMSPLIKSCIAAEIPWERLITMEKEIEGGKALFMKKLLVGEEEAKKAKSHQPKDLAETQMLPFSSGTTGLPKSVEVTHRNIVAMLESISAIPNSISTVKRQLGILPFFHAFALLLNVLIPIAFRQTVWICPTPFNPKTYCEIIEREKIEAACVVPPIFIALTNSQAATKQAFGSLQMIFCGAAPLDKDTVQRFTDKTGMEVRNGWGMTETTVAGIGMHEATKIGSVGKPLPGVEAMCVDVESGKPVKKCERGELWIRAPNVVKGYYKNPKATEDTITKEGWLKTGDVAMTDEEGEFWIVDRIKELIKVKGFQVPPAELEGLLLTHPAVATAAVIGVYDSSQGTEWPRAYVELKDGRKGEKEEEKLAKDIADFIKGKTSPQKQLRGGVRFLDKVPATPSGKLLRKDLRAIVKKEEEEAKGPKSKL